MSTNLWFLDSYNFFIPFRILLHGRNYWVIAQFIFILICVDF